MKIFTDSIHKIAYSADASVYREIPFGVAYPETVDDVKQLLATAREKGTHLIPRAGGTSIAGQVVGSGIVADISKHWNKILEINKEEQWARVQPGVVRDELNLALKPYGLFFSPETSTSNRCCLGGMLGNNSCGTHSLVYGSTRHHALEATAVLTDGSVEVMKDYSVEELEGRFGKDFYRKKEHNSLIESIYAQLIGWAADEKTRQMIVDNYPDRELRRRSCGYAIDEVIEDLSTDAEGKVTGRINLCKLIAGSEGTLAFVTEMKVHLDVLPPKELMVVCGHCDALEKSFEANLVALQHDPTAIELMDGDVLALSKGNAEQEPNRRLVLGSLKGLEGLGERVKGELKGHYPEDSSARMTRITQETSEGFAASREILQNPESKSCKDITENGPGGRSLKGLEGLGKGVKGELKGQYSEDSSARMTRITQETSEEDPECTKTKENRDIRLIHAESPTEKDPAAVLITELRADTREELDRKAEALERDLIESGLVYRCTRAYGNDVSRVWALRKAGLGILGGMKGDAKPMGVIEDTAVAPKRLPAYLKEFREMLDRIGAKCVFYGHISTGELHLRPILNLKSAAGRKMFRDIAYETAVLVRKHRGSISGEHGDGRLRGEFIRMQYGDETYELMRQVKQCWDKDGLLNVHKIVDTLPMDSMLRFDEDQQYAVEKDMGADGTVMNWRAAFDECKVEGASGVRGQVHALMCSIEQCNGAGDCRKSNLMGGTLCPAFKVSGDETWTTRARANVLRELLTRGWEGKSPAEMKEIKEMLDSCLACKGCRRECPSNVDMTRVRAEVLQWIYDRHGTPRRSWLVAHMAQIEAMGKWFRPIYNFAATWKPSAAAIKWFVGFAQERTIPALRSLKGLEGPGKGVEGELKGHYPEDSSAQITQDTSEEDSECTESKENRDIRVTHAEKASRPRVYLFLDEFTKYQEPELAQEFADLLRNLGYEVSVPRHGESGRAAISKGCIRYAKRLAEKNIRLLSPVVKDSDVLVGIEPSCILSFRDEYPDLVSPELRDEAKALGSRALLFDEFIMQEVEAGRITPDLFSTDKMEIWLHGHCHQKALVGVEKTAAMLKLLSGATVHVIPSGCCGMAGSFGYEKEHYKTSLAIGEMVLFPSVREAMRNGEGQNHPTFVVAPGTSCRQQILDGTGVKAVHPISLLSRLLMKV